jgi:hypothetical protein
LLSFVPHPFFPKKSRLHTITIDTCATQNFFMMDIKKSVNTNDTQKKFYVFSKQQGGFLSLSKMEHDDFYDAPEAAPNEEQEEDEEEEEDEDEGRDRTPTTANKKKGNNNNTSNSKKKSGGAIANSKISEEERNNRIHQLTQLLERQRSEFCRLFSTATGDVTAIKVSRFFEYGINAVTKCGSCKRTIIGHCSKVAYMVNDHVLAPYFLADQCFTCHHRLSASAASCGAKDNMLWDRSPSGSTETTKPTRYCHLDRSTMPVCRFHVDTHALAVPSFDPVAQREEMKEFYFRWGFVKARTPASPEFVSSFKEGLVDMLAIMNNRAPDEMRVKMQTDHWETDCTWPGSESQEFGNVCNAPSATYSSYSTLVQDRRAWQTRKLAWDALIPFFSDRDNVSASMAPFVVCPKTEVLTKSFLRSLLTNPRAQHEVMNGFYPYVDTRHDECGISVIVCPESWGMKRTLPNGKETTEKYVFRSLWKGVVPISFPHGRYPDDFPFNNMTVPIETRLGEVVVFRGERPFRLRAQKENLLGMFVGAANVAPKKATKEGRGKMILEQHVRIKLFNWSYYIYPHYETKRAILSMVVPAVLAPLPAPPGVDGDNGGDQRRPIERWGLRKMEDFVRYTQKMTIADFAEFAVQIFGTKHAEPKFWPNMFKNVHGDRAPLGVKSDTFAEKYDSEAIVVEIPSSNSDNKNSGQRKKRKKGAHPPTTTLDNATNMNGTTATTKKIHSKGDKPMQTSTTTTKTAIVPTNNNNKAKTTKVGVDMQTLERSAAKQIQARVKPSSTSPSHVPDDDDGEDREVKTVTSLSKKKKKKVVVAAPEPEIDDDAEDMEIDDDDDDDDDELLAAVPATVPAPKKKKKAIVAAAATVIEDDEDDDEEAVADAESSANNKKKRSRSSTGGGGGRAKTAGIPDNLLFDAEEVAQCLENKDVPTHLRINPDFMESQDELFSVMKNHLFISGPGVPVPEVDEEDQENLVMQTTVEIPCINEDGEEVTEDKAIVVVAVPMNNEAHLQVFDLFSASGIPSSLEADIRKYVISEYCIAVEPKLVAGNMCASNKTTRLYGCSARLGGKITPPEDTPDCIEQMLTCVNETLMTKTMQKPAFNQVIAYTFQTLNAVGNAIKFDQCVPGSSVLVVPLGYSGRVMQLRSLKPGGDPAKTKAVPIMHNMVLVSGLAYLFDETIHEKQELKCSLEIKAESKTPDPCSPLTVLFFMTVNELAPAKAKKKTAAVAKPKSVTPAASSPKKKKQKHVDDDDEEVAPAVVKPEPKKKAAVPVAKAQQQLKKKTPAPVAKNMGGVADDWDPDHLKAQYSELYKSVGKDVLQSADNAFLKNKWTALSKAANNYFKFGDNHPAALPRFKTLFNECWSLAHPEQEEEEDVDLIPMDLDEDDEDPNLVVEGDGDDDDDLDPVPAAAPATKTKQSTIMATMTMVPRKTAKKAKEDEAVVPVALGRKAVIKGNNVVRQSTREKHAAEDKQAIAAVEALPEMKRKYNVYVRKLARKGFAPISFKQWQYNLEHGKTSDSRGLGGAAYGEEADSDDDDEEEDEDFDEVHGYGAPGEGEEDEEGSDDDDDDIVDDDDDDDDVTPAEKRRLKFLEIASFHELRLNQFKDATPQLLIGPNKKLVVSEPYDVAYNAVTLAIKKSTEDNVSKMYKAMGRFEHAYKAYMTSGGSLEKKAKIMAQLYPQENKNKRARPDESPPVAQKADIVEAVVAAGGEISVEGWNPRAPEDVSHQFVMALVDAVTTLSKGNRFCTKMSVFLTKNIIGKPSNAFTAQLMQRFSDDIWPAAKSVMDQGTTRQNALPVPPDGENDVKVAPAAEVLDLTSPAKPVVATEVLPTPAPAPVPPKEKEEAEDDDGDDDEEEEEDSLLQREQELKRANEQAKAVPKTTIVTSADVPVADPMDISEDEDESSSTGGGGEEGPDIALPVPPQKPQQKQQQTKEEQQPVDEEEEEDDDEDAAQGSDAEAAKDGVVVALPVSPNTKNVQRNFPKQASLDVTMEPEAQNSGGGGGGLPLIAYHKLSGGDAIFCVVKSKEQLMTTLKKHAQKEEAFEHRVAPANWRELCKKAGLPAVEQSLKKFTVSQLFGENKN